MLLHFLHENEGNVAIWMNIEDIMPTEISQIDKDKCHMTSFIFEI